jgi:hypothetical protein
VIHTSLGAVGAGETQQFCPAKKRVYALRDRPSDLKQYAGDAARSGAFPSAIMSWVPVITSALSAIGSAFVEGGPNLRWTA